MIRRHDAQACFDWDAQPAQEGGDCHVNIPNAQPGTGPYPNWVRCTGTTDPNCGAVQPRSVGPVSEAEGTTGRSKTQEKNLGEDRKTLSAKRQGVVTGLANVLGSPVLEPGACTSVGEPTESANATQLGIPDSTKPKHGWELCPGRCVACREILEREKKGKV
jgi:hypothetical protein